ncbi:MAG: hypothetical protein ACK5OR_06180 [Betaproteobacteria bacterium]
MSAQGLLAEVCAAHGGLERWRTVQTIEARVAAGGLAFASRAQPSALRDFHATVQPAARRVELRDFGRPGWQGVWAPAYVHRHDDTGTLLGEREQPRAQFDRWVKTLGWDKLDILYFAGYALWNYLSFPFLLTLPDVSTDERAHGKGWQLRARFDADFPTHSREQTFYFDSALRLTRHDYVTDPIARWAAVAHLCLESTATDGFLFHTRRRVYPRLGARRVLPAPLLVHIRIDALHLTTGEVAAAPAARCALLASNS